MLRYSTDTRSETATLGDELEHVQNYLLLSKARYEDNLSYVIDVPAEMRAFILPKLTLQPLVENALTHGYNAVAYLRHVEIHGTIEGNLLCLTVRDSGAGFSDEKLLELRRNIALIESGSYTVLSDSKHIGLPNTCLRLYYYSRGAIHVRVSNDGGAVVRLTIPTHWSASNLSESENTGTTPA